MLPRTRTLRAFPRQRNVNCISRDRKSTRLNSSHSQISYAVFCLKKETLTYASWAQMFGAFVLVMRAGASVQCAALLLRMRPMHLFSTIMGERRGLVRRETGPRG